LFVRKFVEDLEDSDKIFVYTSREQFALAKIKKLADCLRRYGPNPLFYVTLANNTRQHGAFELLSNRLALGHIDRLDGKPSARSLKLWSKICAEAYGLRHRSR